MGCEMKGKIKFAGKFLADHVVGLSLPLLLLAFYETPFVNK